MAWPGVTASSRQGPGPSGWVCATGANSPQPVCEVELRVLGVPVSWRYAPTRGRATCVAQPGAVTRTSGTHGGHSVQHQPPLRHARPPGSTVLACNRCTRARRNHEPHPHLQCPQGFQVRLLLGEHDSPWLLLGRCPWCAPHRGRHGGHSGLVMNPWHRLGRLVGSPRGVSAHRSASRSHGR